MSWDILPKSNLQYFLTKLKDIFDTKFNKSGGTISGNVTVNRENGTASTVGVSQIVLGNSTASGTEKNSQGRVVIYGKGKVYADIKASNVTGTGSNHKNFELPNKSGTFGLDGDYLPITGGTVKATSGNGYVRVEGADNSTNYGYIILVRNSQTVTLAPSDDLASPRTILMPNVSGTMIVGSNNYGKYVGATTTDTTWAIFLKRLRDELFDSLTRRSILRVSELDGYTNLIFHCQRFVNTNTSVWHCVVWDNTYLTVEYFISFGSSSAALRRLRGGSSATDLSSTDPDGAVIYIL